MESYTIKKSALPTFLSLITEPVNCKLTTCTKSKVSKKSPYGEVLKETIQEVRLCWHKDEAIVSNFVKNSIPLTNKMRNNVEYLINLDNCLASHPETGQQYIRVVIVNPSNRFVRYFTVDGTLLDTESINQLLYNKPPPKSDSDKLAHFLYMVETIRYMEIEGTRYIVKD